MADESVEISIRPSTRIYNVLFKEHGGGGADASIEAFDDTWTWGDSAKEALLDIAAGTNRSLQVMMEAMHSAVGENPLMAYLAMMAVRLVELHRVLKPTGTIYLHCDPTASHYLKLVLDAVFGPENFVNEISWRRTTSKADHKQGARHFPRVRDILLRYSKNGQPVFHQPFVDYSEEYLSAKYRHQEPDGRRFRLDNLTAARPGGDTLYEWRVKRPVGGNWEADLDREFEKPRPNWEYRGVRPYKGRSWVYNSDRMREVAMEGRLRYTATGFPEYKRYLNEMPGVPVPDDWDDIRPLNSQAQERLGYPTQKPRALLERIIAASSNAGDLVLDPFCGCGTAVDAAQKLERQWIGIDITHIAIGMIEDRMRNGYPGISFETIGVPKDLASALRLAADDKHQFQQWACWKIGGYPRDKKGGDKGVDGWFNYLTDDNRIATGVISVKGGEHLNPGMVRDLGRVMERDRHRFGLFITAAMPTKGVRDEIASHPLIETQFGRFPAMQVVTIAELIHGPAPRLPPLISPVKKAARVETRTSHKAGAQGSLI
jgi:DNA modification methylase